MLKYTLTSPQFLHAMLFGVQGARCFNSYLNLTNHRNDQELQIKIFTLPYQGWAF